MWVLDYWQNPTDYCAVGDNFVQLTEDGEGRVATCDGQGGHLLGRGYASILDALDACAVLDLTNQREEPK